MLFNSIEFLIFLPIVFVIYWLLKGRLRWQNAFVVVASYFFYVWWDWRFSFLIAFTSLCGYLSGFWIGKCFNLNDNLNVEVSDKQNGWTARENAGWWWMASGSATYGGLNTMRWCSRLYSSRMKTKRLSTSNSELKRHFILYSSYYIPHYANV